MGATPEQILDAEVKSIEHFFIPFLDDMPEDERRAIFERMAAEGVAFAPNLMLSTRAELMPNGYIEAFFADEDNVIEPRRAYLSRFMMIDWREQLAQDRSEGRKDFFRRAIHSFVRDAKEMRAAGVRLLPATDTAVLMVFPGWALHEEIELYVELLDFEPSEAIEAASRSAAEFMGVGDEVGTIAPGMRADLVVLNADPADDIRNTRDIDAVVLRGRVFDRAALDGLLESVASAPDILENDWIRVRAADE